MCYCEADEVSRRNLNRLHPHSSPLPSREGNFWRDCFASLAMTIRKSLAMTIKKGLRMTGNEELAMTIGIVP